MKIICLKFFKFKKNFSINKFKKKKKIKYLKKKKI